MAKQMFSLAELRRAVSAAKLTLRTSQHPSELEDALHRMLLAVAPLVAIPNKGRSTPKRTLRRRGAKS